MKIKLILICIVLIYICSFCKWQKKRPSVTAKLCFQAILEESGQNGRRTVPPALFLAPSILPFSKQFECGVSKETSFVFSRQFIIPERPSASVKCHSMLDLQSVFFFFLFFPTKFAVFTNVRIIQYGIDLLEVSWSTSSPLDYKMALHYWKTTRPGGQGWPPGLTLRFSRKNWTFLDGLN